MADWESFSDRFSQVDGARAWMAIRELRNITVHDYPDEDVEKFLERLHTEYPRLVVIKDRIV